MQSVLVSTLHIMIDYIFLWPIKFKQFVQRLQMFFGLFRVSLSSSCELIVDVSPVVQGKMVLHLSKEPSARLLKHVVRCYLRLSDNPR